MHLVDAHLAGHRRCSGVVVAGTHDHGDAPPLEGADGGRRVRPDRVFEHKQTHERAVTGQPDRRAAEFGLTLGLGPQFRRQVHPLFDQEAVTAEQVGAAPVHAAHAPAGHRGEVVQPVQGQTPLCLGGKHRLGERVLGAALQAGRPLEHLVLGKGTGRPDGGHRRPPLGEGAGLVDHHVGEA